MKVLFGWMAFGCLLTAQSERTMGPLRGHPDNPRYFTDGSKAADGKLKAVYLCGSHTWNSLLDMERAGQAGSFNFERYLDFLDAHHHNFIRLWTWDSSTLYTPADGKSGRDKVHRVSPLPWLRTGPRLALDGKPRFDLSEFNPEYFARLRARVESAQQRGIYVSVMLFEGWGLMHGNGARIRSKGWAWKSHPFNPSNNIGGVDAGVTRDGLSGRVHILGNPEVQAIQRAYIRKVVDTVNSFDNVLYEVINEGGEKKWDWWVLKTVRAYERTKSKQHAIGLTGHGAESLEDLLASGADWTSPGKNDGFGKDPPSWNEDKVSLIDTDHVWGIGGDAAWVWKCFTAGHNPIFMDPYEGEVLGSGKDASWQGLRKALGHSRRLAERLDLAGMTPQPGLASSGYCLARKGVSYVVYQRVDGSVTVDLSGVTGGFEIEWIHPLSGKITKAGSTSGGGKRTLKTPFNGAAVLYLRGK